MPKHKSKGPLSLQGAPLTLKLAPDGTVHLKVVARPPGDAPGQPAEVNATSGDGHQILLQLAPRSDCVILARHSTAAAPGKIILDEVQRHNLRLVAGESYDFAPFLPPDEADEADEADQDPDPGHHQQFDLVELDLEVRLADPALFGGSGGGGGASGSGGIPGGGAAGGGGVAEVDAKALAAAFSRAFFGRVVAVNEYLALRHAGLAFLFRVTGTDTLTPEEQEESVATYHCFRGRVTPETVIYLQEAPAAAPEQGRGTADGGGGGRGAAAAASGSNNRAAAGEVGGRAESSGEGSESESSSKEGEEGGDSQGSEEDTDEQQQLQQQQQEEGEVQRLAQTRVLRSGHVRLLGAPRRDARPPPTNVVHIHTSDGEWFPVKKKLLRPCIALTGVVRDSGSAAASATVNIDTLTFDRALIFLEALALGRKPPEFALHLIEDLQHAAKELGLRALEDYCQRRLGRRLEALGTYTAADVRRATEEGKVWLVIQGMVLDVGRWLPEHPGGSAIIPKQALDCDCSRLFELYHASRESFLYLREFYIGEMLPGEELPQGGGNPAPPSDDFLEQLRGYTSSFRMDPAQLPQGKAFKSF